MNNKKILPIILLVIMAVIALSLKRCNSKPAVRSNRNSYPTNTSAPTRNYNDNNGSNQRGLDRDPSRLFFTKHARCRMQCRHITQAEVKDILLNGNINYNKSELDDPRGPKYAVEGVTQDRQRVRIIFAPNTQHISVVTVIDLEQDYACSCD